MDSNIYAWAARHRVAYPALTELFALFHVTEPAPDVTPGLSEAAVQNNVRLEASRVGARLWRNNVGANPDNGMRWGLANDSAAVNKILKSSDLIGIRPVLITSADAGRTIGQFMAREVKESSWRYAGDKREIAQLNFIKLVTSLGGDACFANGVGTILSTTGT